MNPRCTNLPGIVEIRYLHYHDLPPALLLKHHANIPLGVAHRSTALRFFGEPTCQSEQTDESNGRLETVSLSFHTLDRVPLVGGAFLVRQASGQWWLIGNDELTPVVTVSYDTGTPGGSPAVYTVEVSFKAQKALLPVAV